jgi:cell shape-determining protein MreC
MKHFTNNKLFYAINILILYKLSILIHFTNELFTIYGNIINIYSNKHSCNNTAVLICYY